MSIENRSVFNDYYDAFSNVQSGEKVYKLNNGQYFVGTKANKVALESSITDTDFIVNRSDTSTNTIFNSLNVANHIAESRELDVYELKNNKYFVGAFRRALKMGAKPVK